MSFHTEEDRRRQQWAAAMLKGGDPRKPQMSPDFINQTEISPEMAALAGQDFSGQQDRLSRQRATAMAMMNQQGPQGKVVGDQYLAPNWAEGLSSAFTKGLGAYNYTKGGREGKELDAQEALGREAQAQVGLIRARQAKEEKQAALDLAAANRAQNISREDAAITAAAGQQKLENVRDDAALAVSQGNLKETRDAGSMVEMVGQDGDFVPAVERNGILYEPGGLEPWKREGYRKAPTGTRNITGTPGEFAAEKMDIKRAEERRSADEYARELSGGKSENAYELAKVILNADTTTDALMNPLMMTATGHPLDPQMYASKWGAPGYEGAQSLVRQLNKVSLESAAPMLEKLGVNPTDVDLIEAFKTVPKTSDQPRSWIDWYSKEYIPAFDNSLERANSPMRAALVGEMKSKVREMNKLHYPPKKSALSTGQMSDLQKLKEEFE